MPKFLVNFENFGKAWVVAQQLVCNAIAKGVINRLTIAEVDNNRASLLKSYPDVEKFKSAYQIPQSMMNRMQEMAKEEKIEWKEDEFEKSKHFMSVQLKALMARDLYDSSAFYVIMNDENEIFREGLRIISNPKIYTELLSGD